MTDDSAAHAPSWQSGAVPQAVLAGIRAGLGAAGLGLAVCLLPVLACYLVSAADGAGGAPAGLLRVAGQLWLAALGTGVDITADGGTAVRVGVAPMGVTLLLVAVLVRAARRSLRGGQDTGWVAVGATFAAVYGLCAAGVAALSGTGAVRPVAGRAPLTAGLVALGVWLVTAAWDRTGTALGARVREAETVEVRVDAYVPAPVPEKPLTPPPVVPPVVPPAGSDGAWMDGLLVDWEPGGAAPGAAEPVTWAVGGTAGPGVAAPPAARITVVIPGTPEATSATAAAFAHVTPAPARRVRRVGLTADDLVRAAGVVLRAAAVAGLLLAAAGAALLAVGLVAHARRAEALTADVVHDVPGAVGVFLLCLALLPDAVVWACAFAGGTGFTVGAGTLVAPTAVTLPHTMPALPLLGALPEHAPWWAWFAVAGPVAAGVGAGVYAARAARPGAWVESTGCAAGAAVALGLGFAAAAWFASGPAGSELLAYVGPRPWHAAAALAGEVGVVGVATAAGMSWWRARQRTR